MSEFLTFVSGAIGGFLFHSVTMKVSFKQRTIDNKIKVYDSLISHWVRMRNFIYASPNTNPQALPEFDQMYGQSQTFIGESILVCDDPQLIQDINEFNERLYRTDWRQLSQDAVNDTMEDIKRQGMQMVSRMREDIKNSTRLEWSDFVHIVGGLRRKSQN